MRWHAVLTYILVSGVLVCQASASLSPQKGNEPAGIRLSDVLAPQTLTAQQIAKIAFPSVVMLVMEDTHGQPIRLGSGFFVERKSSGWTPPGSQAITDKVVTNYHVIQGAVSGYAKIVGKKPRYRVAGYIALDEQLDLAILKLTDANAPALPLSDSGPVEVGDEVFAVGNPYGLEGTLSKGIISAIRTIEAEPNGLFSRLAGSQRESRLLQITAALSPGSSGGPILNTKGKVIGVSMATFKEGQNLNFAVPVSYIDAMLSVPHEVKDLRTQADSTSGQSLFDILGQGGNESLVGTHFSWERPYGGSFSFSLRNNLRMAVKDIVCLVVFYDPAGEPIDVSVIKCRSTIPPGLAKRVNDLVSESVWELNAPSVYTLREDGIRSKPSPGKIEFRILDFAIAESGDLF